jgi:hypothetical protein
MRCTFCATGKGGFARNLKAHEIVDQVMTVQEEFGTRVSNIGGAIVICCKTHARCKSAWYATQISCMMQLAVTALRSHQVADDWKDPDGKQSLCSAVQMCLPYSDQEVTDSTFCICSRCCSADTFEAVLRDFARNCLGNKTKCSKETMFDMATNAVFCNKNLCSTAVFMGMGEPLLNLPSVMRAHTMLNENLGVGQRHITISTVGVPNAIMKLASHNLQSTLAISIHAPNQQLREQLVPRYSTSVCFGSSVQHMWLRLCWVPCTVRVAELVFDGCQEQQ